MKRKIVLLALPVLMTLSSCAGVGLKNKDALFVEDTLAHEELFGNVEFLQPNVRKIDYVSDNSPIIGIQYSDESEGKINIRFVAAIKVESEEALAHTTAVWTRTMYDGTGALVARKGTEEFAATKAYTRINGGGDDLSIGSIGDGSYSYFVVYTMMNIPVTGANDASDYYLNAYLTIDDEENPAFDKVSKVVSTTIDGSKKTAFDCSHIDYDGYFISGTCGDIMADAVPEDGNVASWSKAADTWQNLDSSDSFVIVKSSASSFKMIGSSVLAGKSSYYFSNATGNIGVNFDGGYKLYLQTESLLYSEGHDVTRPVYIKLDGSAAAWSTSNQIVIYAFKSSPAANRWFDTNSISGGFVTKQSIDPTEFDYIKIVEIKSGNTLDWSNKVDDHETDNLAFPSAPDFEGDNPQKAAYAWHRTYSGGVNYWGSSWGTF